MQIYRLFIDTPFIKGNTHILNDSHAHYVRNVVRLNAGEYIEVFNGVDGVWRAQLSQLSKKLVEILFETQLAPQTNSGMIDVYFAPLKNPRLEYSIQKMVEMGARSITPVKTQHAQMQHYNFERIQNYCIEGAQQCGIVSLPKLNPLIELSQLITQLPEYTKLIYCDEAAAVQNPLFVIQSIPNNHKIGILIGPEGGFSAEERESLRQHQHIIPVALGPRILRADTALVAAMAVVQGAKGDW